jgi:hypothetical protein
MLCAATKEHKKVRKQSVTCIYFHINLMRFNTNGIAFPIYIEVMTPQNPFINAHMTRR